MFKNKIALSIFATTISFGSSAASQSFDARSYSMGGIGVSSSDYVSAVFHNPALVARWDGSDDIGLLLPFAGVQFQDPNQIIDQIDDFSNLYDQIGSSNDPNDVQKMIDSLEKMQGDAAYVQASLGGAIAIPTEFLSFNLYGKVYADALVLADINSDDLEPNNYTTSYDLKSEGITLGVAVSEFGVAFAKSFETEKGTWYVGMTPKYQQVKTINYSVSINSYDFDDWDNEDYQSDDGNFNVDLGVAYSLDQGWVFGLSGRNLIENKYNTIVSDSGLEAVYVVSPIYTASTSFNHSLFTVGIDVDLNENKRYESIVGLQSGNIDTSGDNTQMAGIGLEFNAWDWAQLRAGYQYDIAGNLDGQVTGGIGFSPFGVFHMDLSASYAGEDQFGATLQTAFTF